MTRLQYILKSFLHYFKANLLVAFGVAISTMVLTGSLIIGDSVRYSLKQATFYRLGETTHLVSVRERYFRQEMANEIEKDNPNINATPLLLLEGMAVADGGQQRANKVQIIGIDKDFTEISNSPLLSEIQNNEIIISENLAEKLQKTEGDNILVRIKKASLIPMNAPFVSAEETSVALRASISKIVSKEELGRFNLKNSQTAPYNIFVSIDRLNRLMEFEGKANQILIVTNVSSKELAQSVKNCLRPADAGLSIKTIEKSDEIEILTERVFLDEKVSSTLKRLPGAEPILTYFVNGIGKTEDRRPKTEDEGSPKLEARSQNTQSQSISVNLNQSPFIPYSFVSSTSNSQLSNNEVILNHWAADDLNAKVGDNITLKYFEIGPLRQLIEKESDFILKEIISMDNDLSDETRVPHLPGLSDAGHCREWEAGVPIELDAIREKDEKYWDDFKGTPKAFISTEKALEMWSNRFGNYTAFRYPAETFNQSKYEQIFAQEVAPADLGMVVEPIRKQGINAAENGTDFSGLFIGLSFFLLAASIILTALLFRLNLENRSSQIGLLSALGFQQKQVRNFYLQEGLVISLFGALIGLLVSVYYTQLVFKILNSLWFEIVRTNVLEIKILSATLILGLVIGILVSLAAIFISVKRFQNRKTIELQKQIQKKESRRKELTINTIIFLTFGITGVLLINELISGQLNPSMFFLSGGLLLVGFLLLFRKKLSKQNKKEKELHFKKLAKLNLSRNPGRSLTVVILFALGTFLVVSTGSNKLDLFANSHEKSSGTGGFLYFAETTMPVLYNINNKEKRVDEGIYEDFEVVQFRKVEGDDASCLNLNRIAQPAVLGVEPKDLKNRFSFAVKIKGLEKEPWQMLDENFEDGSIPAIADQTVIQWGLGMKVGDILMYQNELGDTLRLKLIAGTTPSIFQGFVIISNKHFLQNYPTSSGSNIFLIDGKQDNSEAIGDELNSVFRDYGWEMESTAKRLVEFYSVTNTYLSIFLALGALGLILGTIGLAVILARTILERKREIAVMQALGFSSQKIFILLFREYSILLISGVLIGFITAVIATLPAFLSTNTDASFSTVTIVVSLILTNGLLWIIGLSWFSLRNNNKVAALRSE